MIEAITYAITLVPVCLMGYGSGVGLIDDPYRWMLAYFLGLCLFLAFEALADAPPFFVFLGSISYSIYLLHEAVFKAFQTMLGDGRQVLIGCLSLLAIVLVSWASYRLVERPCQQVGRKLIGRLALSKMAEQRANIVTHV
jgi:peptidoglycan/LPS O-acetylase OafA/YrhL